MEIQYQKDDDEDGFVMVERVTDSLRVLAFDEVDLPDVQLGEQPAASAETTAAGEKGVEMPDADGQVRYNHLPADSAPKLMQTPQSIPPLYPFNRTNVYILISPEAAQGTIKSVILKGSSPEEPFKLEIPVEVLSERGETIHQLAAKKAVNELEEGRGWLVHAKDEKGALIKTKYSDRFQSMVEREAVRLGIQYQIAGKFTSFVATETDPENPENIVSRKSGIFEEADIIPQVPNAQFTKFSTGSLFGGSSSASIPRGTQFGNSVAYKSASSALPCGSLSHTPLVSYSQSARPSKSPLLSGSGGASNFSAPFSGASSGLFGSVTGTQQSGRARMSTSGNAPRRQLASMAASPFSADPAQHAPIHGEVDTKAEETDPLQKIIALQTFEGYWNLDAPLLEVVGLSAQHKAPQGVDSKVWAAMLAITFLEGKMAGDEEVWEMVVDKARGWLKDVEKGQEGVSDEMWTLAERLIMGPD